MTKITCEICNKKTKKKHWNHRFCSDTCRYKYYYSLRQTSAMKKIAKRKCKECGKKAKGLVSGEYYCALHFRSNKKKQRGIRGRPYHKI